LRYQSTHGLAPTVEEMRVALGYRSKGSVYRLLAALEARGRIRRLPRRARALEVMRETAPSCGLIAGSGPGRTAPSRVLTLRKARWADVSSSRF
jgi:repressor LexA